MSYVTDRIRQRYTAGTDGNAQIQRYTDAGILTAAEYAEITGEVYVPTPNELTDAVNALETLGYTESTEGGGE